MGTWGVSDPPRLPPISVPGSESEGIAHAPLCPDERDGAAASQPVVVVRRTND